MNPTAYPTLAKAMPETYRDSGRELVETLIDQMVDQSFPASDPPAWGVARARLDQANAAHPFDN
jgi:hypothetical protein